MIRPSVRHPHTPLRCAYSLPRRSHSQIAANIARNNYKHAILPVGDVHHFRVDEVSKQVFAAANKELVCIDLAKNKRVWAHRAKETHWKYPVYHSNGHLVAVGSDEYQAFRSVNVFSAANGVIQTELPIFEDPSVQIGHSSFFILEWMNAVEYSFTGKKIHEFKGSPILNSSVFKCIGGHLFIHCGNKLRIADLKAKKSFSQHIGFCTLKIQEEKEGRYRLLKGLPGYLRYAETDVACKENQDPLLKETYRFDKQMAYNKFMPSQFSCAVTNGEDRVFLSTFVDGRLFSLDKSTDALNQLQMGEPIWHLSMNEYLLAVTQHKIQFWDPKSLKIVVQKYFQEPIRNVKFLDGALYANINGKIHCFDYKV